MDDIVRAALAKWPNVPHCFGWLALDARGDWYMRDERIQHAGPFPRVKGSRIDHPKLKAFIERNYDADEHGAWFFQNGPQRVYLQLEAAPWVWRLQWRGDELQLRSHTGRDAVLNTGDGCLLDEHGRLFLATDIGLGLVHTQDMDDAARAVELGRWSPQDVAFAALPQRFGYQLDPRP
ncbi:Protein of unknown function (DUF2946) [Burkholderiales bacterium JOSHI_001]|nr:Protein of unknown function (DUF2946) [Burkholderiales bacterium JOSHI_001]